MAVAAFVRILRTTVKRLSFIVRGIPPRDWPRFFLQSGGHREILECEKMLQNIYEFLHVIEKPFRN